VERLVASIATRAQDALFERVTAQPRPELYQTIDRLLTVPEGAHRSPLFYLKAYPPEATPPALLTYLEREQFLRSLGVGAITLREVHPDVIAHLAQLGPPGASSGKFSVARRTVKTLTMTRCY